MQTQSIITPSNYVFRFLVSTRSWIMMFVFICNKTRNNVQFVSIFDALACVTAVQIACTKKIDFLEQTLSFKPSLSLFTSLLLLLLFTRFKFNFFSVHLTTFVHLCFHLLFYSHRIFITCFFYYRHPNYYRCKFLFYLFFVWHQNYWNRWRRVTRLLFMQQRTVREDREGCFRCKGVYLFTFLIFIFIFIYSFIFFNPFELLVMNFLWS
jgi:hypothetical protein